MYPRIIYVNHCPEKQEVFWTLIQGFEVIKLSRKTNYSQWFLKHEEMEITVSKGYAVTLLSNWAKTTPFFSLRPGFYGKLKKI